MSTLSIPQSINRPVSISVTPEVSSIVFPAGFSASDASRVDNSLILTTQDGAQVTLTDFFVVEEGGALPTLQISDGAAVTSEAFLASVNPDMDMTTAAGPSSAPSSSGGSYSDESGDLIGGLDRLGSLDGTSQWSGDTPSSFSVAAASMPGDGGDADLPGAGGGLTPPVVPPVNPPVVPPTPDYYFSRSVFGGADAGTNDLDTVATNFTQTIALYDSVTGQRITGLSNADLSGFNHSYFTVTPNADGTLTLTLTAAGLEALRGGNTALFEEFTVTDDNGTYKAQVAVTPDPDLTDADLAAKFADGDVGLKGEWVRSERLMDADIDLTNLEDGGIHIVDKGHESLMPFLNFSAAVTGATTINAGGNDVTIEASNEGLLGLVTGVYGGNQGKVSITNADNLNITASAENGAVSGITAMDAEIEANTLKVTVQNSALATGLAMVGTVDVDTADINVTNNMIASGMHFDGDFTSTGDTTITVSAREAALGIGMGSGFELHNDRMTGESPETNINVGGTLTVDVQSQGHAAGVGNMGFAVTDPDFAKTDSTINLTADKVDLKVTVGGSAYGVATLKSMDNGYTVTNIQGDEVSIVVYGGYSATGVVARDGGINTISGSTITISARYGNYGELGTALYAGSDYYAGRESDTGSINLITGTGTDDIILIDGHVSTGQGYTDNGQFKEVDNQNVFDLGAGDDELTIIGRVTSDSGRNIINMGEGRDTLTIHGLAENVNITDIGNEGGQINLNGGASFGMSRWGNSYHHGQGHIHADTSDISIKEDESGSALTGYYSESSSVKTGGNILMEGSYRGVISHHSDLDISGKHVEIIGGHTGVESYFDGNVVITGMAVVIKGGVGGALFSGDSNCTITVNGTGGADIIKIEGAITATDHYATKNIISTGAGDDIIVLNSKVSGSIEIDGGAGSDTLILLADDWTDFTTNYKHLFENGIITDIESVRWFVNGDSAGTLPSWLETYCNDSVPPIALSEITQAELDAIDGRIADIKDKPAESIGVTEEALPDVNPETPATTPPGPEVTDPGVSGAVVDAVRDESKMFFTETTIVADKMASDFNYAAGVWDAKVTALNNVTINAGQDMTRPVYGSIAAGVYGSGDKETVVQSLKDITINAVGHSANGIASTTNSENMYDTKTVTVEAANDLTINATGYIAAGVASYAAVIKAGHDISINVDADMAGGRASGAMFAGGMGANNDITLTVRAEQEAIGLTVVKGNPFSNTNSDDGVVQAGGSIKVDVESEKALATGISLMTGTGLYLDTDLESTIKAQNNIDVLVKSGDRAQGVSALTSLDTSHSATIDMQALGKITVAAEGAKDYASAYGLFASGPGAQINVAAPAVEITATTVYGQAYGVYTSNGGKTSITGNQITISGICHSEYGYSNYNGTAMHAAGEGSSNTVNGTGLDDVILITGGITSDGYGTSSNTISTYGGNDLLSISKGHISGNVNIDLGTGNDTLTFVRSNVDGGTYDLGSGNDSLHFDSSYIGSGRFNMGEGNDTLRVEYDDDVSYKSFYGMVDMGDGNNTVEFIGGTVGNRITMGNGNDVVSMTNTESRVTLDTGAGDDKVSFVNSSITSGTINTGDGNDSISLAQSSLSSMTINMGDGNDTLTMSGGTFSYGTIDTGGGADSISMTGATISTYYYGSPSSRYTTKLDAGEGNDTLTLDSVTVYNTHTYNRVNLGMGEGDDSVELSGNMVINTNNAFLHGGDGIDTLDLSGLTGWKFNNTSSDDVKLSQIAKVADSFEVIDLTGGSGTDLVIDTLLGDFVGDKIGYDATKVDATDIVGLESLWNGAEKVLVVNRDQDDTVNVDANVWQDKGSVEYNGITYNAYTSSDEAQMILIQSQF